MEAQLAKLEKKDSSNFNANNGVFLKKTEHEANSFRSYFYSNSNLNFNVSQKNNVATGVLIQI